MEFDEVVKKRKSVRSFLSKPVDFRAILDAIHSANLGPYAGNVNNMKYVIVEDKREIEALAKHAEQTWISNAQAVIVVCTEDMHIEKMYGERGRIYSRQQAGAAINTIMLKLTELGISTCWVGAYTDEVIRGILGAPAHVNIEAIIPVGYERPVKGEVKKRKKEVGNVIYWDVWERGRRPTILSEGPLRNPNQPF